MATPDSRRPLRPSLEKSTSSDLVDEDDEDDINQRKNVRSACTNCKRRKLKCSGIMPCAKCEHAGLECWIDEQGDQRRKQILKRKIESVEDKGGLLDHLISTLQETDKASAMQVVNMIRSQASLEDIRGYLDDILQRPKLEKTPELIDAYSGVRDWHDAEKRASESQPSIEDVATGALFHVPARPWTSVTDDAEFVSHLISLWFTWYHPFLNWIDRDLFIRDMKSGDLHSQFCSPFLVNIILAEACVYSKHPGTYTVGSEDWSRGLKFYKEAKRLLDTDDVDINIPYVQGLGVMYVCSCMMGKDRAGWVYISQLAYAVGELAQKHKPPPESEEQEIIEHEHVMRRTQWGVFNLAAMTSLSYQKGCMFKPPRVMYPPSDIDLDDWTNYPDRSQKIKSNSQALFSMFCEVSRITYDLSWSLFGDGETKPTLNADFVKMTDDAYSRLKKWYEGFPGCLGVGNAAPHVLSFHMKYHTIIQTVFGVLKDLPIDKDKDLDVEWEEEIRQGARRKCVESAREVARLIYTHGESWSLERVAPVNIHWITVSMFTLLPYLDDIENQMALDRLTVASRGISRSWSLARGMLRLLQVTAKQMEVKLPLATETTLDDFELKDWGADESKNLSSQYPNFANSTRRGEVDEVELDKFLAKFDELYTADLDADQFTASTPPPDPDPGQGRRRRLRSRSNSTSELRSQPLSMPDWSGHDREGDEDDSDESSEEDSDKDSEEGSGEDEEDEDDEEEEEEDDEEEAELNRASRQDVPTSYKG